MKIAVIIVRTLVGLLFLFASVSYFAMVYFHMGKMPPVTGNMKVFNEGLAASGYLMLLVKVIELICALLLLFGRYVALTLVVLFPILVNIVLVHAFLEPSGLAMVIPLLAAVLFLAYTQREKYAPMFTAK